MIEKHFQMEIERRDGREKVNCTKGNEFFLSNIYSVVDGGIQFLLGFMRSETYLKSRERRVRAQIYVAD